MVNVFLIAAVGWKAGAGCARAWWSIVSSVASGRTQAGDAIRVQVELELEGAETTPPTPGEPL